jgi:hypothetical protein
MRRSRIRNAVLAAIVGWSSLAVGQEAQTLHVYHIGNSLTRSITMDRLHLLFAEHGIDYQFSTQLAAGCPLNRHWAAREKGMKTKQWETNKPAGDDWEPGGPDWDPNPQTLRTLLGSPNEAQVGCHRLPDGAKITEIPLDAAPVFDGLSAAHESVFLVTEHGEVL